MSCPIGVESTSALSLALQRASQLFIPFNVTIELSQRCNLRCSHCYNFDRSQSARPKQGRPALSSDEIVRVLHEIREAGALIVAFTGGEALLHPDLLRFVRVARSLKLAVRLKSNGTLITPARAEELRQAGVTDLEVSLYGAAAATHDRFTRVPGSFEKTVSGVMNAQKADITTQINFVMHHECVDEYAAMIDLAQSLGAAYSMGFDLTKRYDGTSDSLDLRLTRDDLLKLYRGPRRRDFTDAINRSDSVQCACARTNAGIGFDGTVYPCIGAPIPSGDLRQASFQEIWRNSENFNWIRSLTLKDFKDCSACADRPYCQRSSGAIFANTGDYTGSEPWTCEQAALLRELNRSAAAEDSPRAPDIGP